MNDYIKMLSDQNKLSISISPNRWQFDENPYIISGPCSVESEEMIVDWAHKMKRLGVNALRGGAYKPCTYPIMQEIGENGWKEGLREEGYKYVGFNVNKNLEKYSKIYDQINEMKSIANSNTI